MAACVVLRPGRTNHCRGGGGGGSGDRHMPGGRRPLVPANGGVTEDWGKVILKIKEDLPAMTAPLYPTFQSTRHVVGQVYRVSLLPGIEGRYRV